MGKGGFFTGAVILLLFTFIAVCFDVALEVEVVELPAGAGAGAGGFPAVEVVITGLVFTNTGSVDGMGLPNLV